MIDHIVTGRSMKEIRDIVQDLRNNLGLGNVYRFPLMKFYENIIPALYPEYRFLYVDSKDLNGEEAYTDHIKKEIRIRTDVYERALCGSAKDLFTIAHEIGHLFLHKEECFVFSRTRERYPAYKSAEWQANYFAAELLMPSHLILDLSIEEITNLCGVSKKAASIQLNHAIIEFVNDRL